MAARLIPLNFGLRPDQYDTQAEVNAILGELAGHPFSTANTVRYIFNDQFLAELRKSLLETRSYHVVWIHDYKRDERRTRAGPRSRGPGRGRLRRGLRRAIQAWTGESGTIFPIPHPSRRVLLPRKHSEAVVSFLEALGSATSPDLPSGELRTRVQAGAARLRETIAASSALRGKGADYVRRRVKVQVAITHPYDPTFMDDMVMRDHTKIAFHDVFEEDPTSGEAFFTGMGIGEHYVGPHWEDRTLAVRGTEIVRVKDAARALLISQGLKPDQLPRFLRERPYPAGFAQTCDSLRAAGWTAAVLTVTNGTGFRTKSASVLKAAIYNLMTRGRRAPGAGLSLDERFLGRDVRLGGAPRVSRLSDRAGPGERAEQRPADHGPHARDLWMLFRSSELLDEAYEQREGPCAWGSTPTKGTWATSEALSIACSRTIGRTCRFTTDPDASFRARILAEEYERMEGDSTARACDDRPPSSPADLHLKAQFFANGTAVGLLAREEWSGVLSRYLEVRRGRQPGRLRRENRSARPSSGVEGMARGRAGRRLFGVFAPSSEETPSPSPPSDPTIRTGGACCSTAKCVGGLRRGLPPAMIDFAFLMGTATWPKTVGGAWTPTSRGRRSPAPAQPLAARPDLGPPVRSGPCSCPGPLRDAGADHRHHPRGVAVRVLDVRDHLVEVSLCSSRVQARVLGGGLDVAVAPRFDDGVRTSRAARGSYPTMM